MKERYEGWTDADIYEDLGIYTMQLHKWNNGSVSKMKLDQYMIIKDYLMPSILQKDKLINNFDDL